MGRDIGTRPGSIGITPSMVLAPQLRAIIGSDSQSNPAMPTPVLPDIDKTIIGAPDRQILARQPAVKNVTRYEIRTRRNRDPLL